jgi:hypothetical protein
MINVVNTDPKNEGKTFRAFVHKELLCFYSPYYTVALQGGFPEAKKDTMTMELPWFQMRNLVSWLYSSTLTDGEECDLTDLYVFADEKMMLALRRSIMSRLIEVHDLVLPMKAEEVVPYLRRLPQNSGLFRYMVDYFGRVWSTTGTQYEMETLDRDQRLPRAFFYQVVEKLCWMIECGGISTDALKAACNFHEHVNYFEWVNSMS